MAKFLITGATGHLGKGAIDFLLQKGIPASSISALIRDESKAADLKEKGVQLVVADYNNYTSLVHAFKDVDKLLFVSGSDVLNRLVQQENVVNAAREAGVKHVIYTSILHNSTVEKSAIGHIAAGHIKTEEWLAESGLVHTIMKNNLYADLVPLFIGNKVLETGTIYLPGAEGRTAYTLRADIAEAAAVILTTQGHQGKSYNISNTETYSYQDVADIISTITGKAINYVSPSPEEFRDTLKGAGVPDEAINGLVSFVTAQAQNEFDIIGDDLENLLGRKPTTLEAYLRTVYDA